jgi:hemolysin activation/secretion protein
MPPALSSASLASVRLDARGGQYRMGMAKHAGARDLRRIARQLAAAGAGAALAIAATSVQAQIVSPPIGVVTPPPPTDLARPQTPLAAPAAPLIVHAAPAEAVPAGAANITVTVASLDIDGVTAYAPGALDPLYKRLVGRSVPLSEIFAAAERIQTRYRQDGYILTRVVVPEQTVGDGRFHIRVVEGYVASVEINGDAGAALPLVRRYLDKITRHRPARLKDIERYLLLTNDLPGISAHSVLTPAPDATGAAILLVQVEHKALDAYATINNRGSDFAGPVTGTLDLAANDIGAIAGRLEATGLTTFNNQQDFGQVSFEGHVGDEGARLRAFYSYGPSAPGSILAPLDIRSLAQIVGLGGDYPLIRSRRFSLSLNGDIEVTRDDTSSLGHAISRDRQSVVRIGLAGDYADAWGGQDAASITLHQGLDLFGPSHDGGSIQQSRLGGDSQFSKVTGTASRLQPLWSGDQANLAVLVSFAGQYAADKLLALEQFHIGGEAFGRGYIPAQASGDDALAGSIELQLTGLRPIGPLSRQQLYGFFDDAGVWNRDAGAGWQALQSYGAGLRADLGRQVSGQVELAVPYDPGRLNGARLDRGVQVFFGLTARY